jgi:hypothetical protein
MSTTGPVEIFRLSADRHILGLSEDKHSLLLAEPSSLVAPEEVESAMVGQVRLGLSGRVQELVALF